MLLDPDHVGHRHHGAGRRPGGRRGEVITLADRIPGCAGYFAGRLRNAAQVEALTANLISINRRYKVHAGYG